MDRYTINAWQLTFVGTTTEFVRLKKQQRRIHGKAGGCQTSQQPLKDGTEGTEIITQFCMGGAAQRVVVCPGVHYYSSCPAAAILFPLILRLSLRNPHCHSFQWFLFNLASDQTC